jgi:hypothetical protein
VPLSTHGGASLEIIRRDYVRGGLASKRIPRQGQTCRDAARAVRERRLCFRVHSMCAGDIEEETCGGERLIGHHQIATFIGSILAREQRPELLIHEARVDRPHGPAIEEAGGNRPKLDEAAVTMTGVTADLPIEQVHILARPFDHLQEALRHHHQQARDVQSGIVLLGLGQNRLQVDEVEWCRDVAGINEPTEHGTLTERFQIWPLPTKPPNACTVATGP